MAAKCLILNELAKPFGYYYDVIQDIFTGRQDAWQKNYGYSALYDKSAPFFNMIFDCLPVYFDYAGKTWLIELWKGQYGINTGSEVGIYHTESVIPERDRKYAWYKAVNEHDYIDMSTALYYRGRRIAKLRKPHWWLTMFVTGRFCNPDDLSLRVTLRFFDLEMRNAFINSLYKVRDKADISDLVVCSTDVSFVFNSVMCTYNPFKRIFRWYVQCKNRLFVRLYLFVTRPFKCNLDRILYLYYYIPFIFRRTLRIKHYKKRRH